MIRHFLELLNSFTAHHDEVTGAARTAAQDALVVSAAILTWLCLGLCRARAWQALARVGATLALSLGLAQLAALAHPESRPFVADLRIHALISHSADQSFPSDHTLATAAIATAVLMFVSRAWGAALLGLAGATALARVAVGVHWPQDALASIVIAAVAAYVVRRAGEQLAGRRGLSPAADAS